MNVMTEEHELEVIFVFPRLFPRKYEEIRGN